MKFLSSIDDVTKYEPDAVIVPGNVVPHFWPGLKVQIFHGLGEEKKGHYRITGFFDLYCTPGPHMTEKFQTLSEKHGHFLVKETGWPKLDTLNTSNQIQRKIFFGLQKNNPIILYAPTFSPRYTSAPALLSTIIHLCNLKSFHWFIKFHPLMDSNTILKYKPNLYTHDSGLLYPYHSGLYPHECITGWEQYYTSPTYQYGRGCCPA